MRYVLIILGFLLCPVAVLAAGFGGPDSVDNTLEDRQKRDWRDYREHWKQEYGLNMGLDYYAVFLGASDVFPGTDDTAGSGIVRFFGSWDAIDSFDGYKGSLIWKIEHRHPYLSTTPKAFGLGNVGIAGMMLPAFSDQKARLTNLYWKSKFNEQRSSVVVGFLDVTDYVDTYALASPWSGFYNLAFSTGAAAIGLPDDGLLGIAGGHMFTDQFYGILGIADANGDSSDPFKGFETFFSDNQYFKTLELGWTASQDRIYLDNFHLTGWHMDGGTKNSVKDSQGINYSFSYMVTPQIMPFLRGGFSSGDASLASTSVSLGMGYFALGGEGNTLGLAANWTEPNEEAFGPGLDSQTTLEAYYHWQLTKILAITPDIQYINSPSLNTAVSDTWVYGLRARLAI